MSRTPEIGTVVDGRYKLLGRAGGGAMGAVFIAQEGDEPKVALKMVLELDESFKARERFVREVQTLNKLEHPNIVELLDFGFEEQSKTPYLVMELVPGTSLSSFTSRRKMAVNFVVHVAREVCLGLAAAHNEGVVHRDIKPGNLMVYPDHGGMGVKILDFGLAFARDAETKLTRTGTMPGTVSYMAPEALRGDVLDGRADIYALGCILFELLSGQMPFTGANQTDVGMAHLMKPVPKVRKLVPEVPPEIDRLIQRFLAKDRDKRPESAGEAAYELTELMSKLGLVAPSAPPPVPS